MNKRPDTITIKAADFDDLKYALSKGAADFFALPYYGLFFGFIFVFILVFIFSSFSFGNTFSKGRRFSIRNFLKSS